MHFIISLFIYVFGCKTICLPGSSECVVNVMRICDINKEWVSVPCSEGSMCVIKKNTIGCSKSINPPYSIFGKDQEESSSNENLLPEWEENRSNNTKPSMETKSIMVVTEYVSSKPKSKKELIQQVKMAIMGKSFNDSKKEKETYFRNKYETDSSEDDLENSKHQNKPEKKNDKEKRNFHRNKKNESKNITLQIKFDKKDEEKSKSKGSKENSTHSNANNTSNTNASNNTNNSTNNNNSSRSTSGNSTSSPSNISSESPDSPKSIQSSSGGQSNDLAPSGNSSKPGDKQSENTEKSSGLAQKEDKNNTNDKEEKNSSGGGSGILTSELINKLCAGKGTPNSKFVSAVVSVFKDVEKELLAIYLAQMMHESGCFQHIEEIACKGKTCSQYGTGAPGKSYHGRGFIQLTWPDNYKQEGANIGLGNQLYDNPEKVSDDPIIGAKVSKSFLDKKVKPAIGSKGSYKFGAATKVINGAIECGGKGSTTPEKRYELYQGVAKELKIDKLASKEGC